MLALAAWRSCTSCGSSAVPLLLLRPSTRHCSSTPSQQAAVVYEDHQLPSLRSEDLPLPVWRAMQQLRAAGHTVLLVGGAVRDLLLLGSTPTDYDLLTSAHLSQVKQVLADKPRIFGRTFPICQLVVDGVRIEVSSMHTRAPHRIAPAAAAAIVPPDAAHILQAGPRAAAAAALTAASGQIGRHRRSKATTHHSWQQHQQQRAWGAGSTQQQQQQRLSWAAARRDNALGRDFTANCLLYDPFAGLVFDYLGGVADVQARLLRCNGPPAERFSRDPACMLRAVRCAARAGLSIEPSTLAALQQHSHLVSSLNTHRVAAELQSMLGYGAAAASMQLLAQVQLLQHVLPLHAAHLQRHRYNNAGRSTISINSSSSGSDSCHPAGLQQQHFAAAQTADQPHAASALGQLWSQLHTPQQQLQQLQQQSQQASVVQPAQPAADGQAGPKQHQQQQQQQEQEQHHQELVQQQQQLGHTNSLLLQVLAALDQHVSVSQPASAEVVLACLTAPLLAEGLAEAVRQLQQRQMQQQAASQHVEAQQAEAAAADAPELLQALAAGSRELHHHASTAADVAMHLRLQRLSAQTSHSLTRPFSSSSSLSRSGAAADSLPSRVAAAVVEQLLQGGVSVPEVMQQQARHIATMVCQPPGPATSAAGGTAEEQSAATQPPLFGVHAQAAAADLLLAQLQLGTPKPAAASSSASSSSSQQRQQKDKQQRPAGAAGLDLWDDYAQRLPRSNRQFLALMQQPCWDLTPGALVIGSGGDGGGSEEEEEDAEGCTLEQQAHAEAEQAAAQLLRAVLGAAGLDFVALQQRLQQQLCYLVE